MRKSLVLGLMLIVSFFFVSCSSGEVNAKKDVSYKTVNYAGCSFLIPEGTEAADDGDALSYTFDDNNSLTLRFTIHRINDWTETEKNMLNSIKSMEGFEINSSKSEVLDDKQVLITEATKSKFKIKAYCINADNEGVFMVVYTTSLPDYPYQEEIDTIVSSFDASGISDYIADNTNQSEESVTDEDTDTDEEVSASKAEESENENKIEEVEQAKENETQEPAQKQSNGGITYDEDGYILLTYSNRGMLSNIDKPNVHLAGTLVDANNICFTIEDEDGHTWTGESAGGLDFTDYIGTECDIYGFCSGGISNRYNTPLIDMAYDDSHISFSDGLSYYPNDNESYAQFPRWDFEGEQKNDDSGTLVWIPTDGGTKYHSYDGCSGMDNPEQVTEEEAIERGYSRCGKCW